MKIGDLVELSARGKNIKLYKAYIGSVGMICEVDSTRKFSDDPVEWYYVNWCGGANSCPHLRLDLKYVSKRQ